MRFLDLFSGIGGFHLGMTMAGHTCVGACDINENARYIYQLKFPNTKIYDDVRKLDGRKEFKKIDCITAGFPCQPFSTAGLRGGFEESRGDLFFEIIRIARETRCQFLFLENVPGLLFFDGGYTFTEILKALDVNGFDAQWQVLSSQYYTGQDRLRIFIIAYLRSATECRPKIFPFSNREQEICGGLYREKIIKESKNYKKIKREGPDNNNLIIPIEYKFTRRNKVTACTVGEYGDPAHTILVRKTRIMAYNNNKYTVRYTTPNEDECLQGFPKDWTQFGKVVKKKNNNNNNNNNNNYDIKIMSDGIRHGLLGNAVTVPVIQMIAERLKRAE